MPVFQVIVYSDNFFLSLPDSILFEPDILELNEKGFTMRQIGLRLRISKSSVRCALDKMKKCKSKDAALVIPEIPCETGSHMNLPAL